MASDVTTGADGGATNTAGPGDLSEASHQLREHSRTGRPWSRPPARRRAGGGRRRREAWHGSAAADGAVDAQGEPGIGARTTVATGARLSDSGP